MNNVNIKEENEDKPGNGQGTGGQSLVKALVAEATVVIDLHRASMLLTKLNETQEEANQYARTGIKSEFGVPSKGLREGSNIASDRLRLLLDGAFTPPNMPAILYGPLPLEPSLEYKQAQAKEAFDRDPQTAGGGRTKPVEKLMKPKFRVDDLFGIDSYKRAVHGLYHGMSHQHPDDALRFRTAGELAKYTGTYLTKKTPFFNLLLLIYH